MFKNLSFLFHSCLVEIVDLKGFISDDTGGEIFIVPVVFEKENKWGLTSAEIEIPFRYSYDQINFVLAVKEQLGYYVSQ